MRKIVHISDVHFGRVDYATVRPLVRAAVEVAPDLVVVSGDLTQRARASQFREARTFLAALPSPQLVVPGNHDVPFYDVLSRFAMPYRNYRRFVGGELDPSYADAEIVVQGINTARSLTWKNGRINSEQVDLACRRFAAGPTASVKILVTHHPLDLPRQFSGEELVGGAAEAMPALAAAGVDVLLAGHYHIAHTGDTITRYPIPGFSALVVQSGTSTSSRLRDETNSFNLLEIDGRQISVDRFTWRPTEGVFASLLCERFEKSSEGWVRASTERPDGKEIAVAVGPVSGAQ
jgi:3',5'-cyclic AMP phosphodiesterase CpdA